MHYKTTGPEILSAIDVDVFVAGVGTGGTISGVSKYLKEHRDVVSVAVEPKDSPVISGGQPGPHMIQGIGAGFVPKNLNRAIIDEIYTISNNDAVAMANKIAVEEGVVMWYFRWEQMCMQHWMLHVALKTKVKMWLQFYVILVNGI